MYALTSEKILGGAIGWSGHLFQSFELKNKDKIPLLINHGEHDSMVPFEMAMKSYESILKEEKVIFRSYKLNHEVSIEQMGELREWL